MFNLLFETIDRVNGYVRMMKTMVDLDPKFWRGQSNIIL